MSARLSSRRANEPTNRATIVALDHRQEVIALRIHAVQMLAYAQEAALLQAKHFPPLARTPTDIQASDERFLGALVGPDLAGAVSLELGDTPARFTIASLVVDPAHQRGGIGRSLLTAALAECAGATVEVSTGAKNAPALALYHAFGFVEHARHTVGAEALELISLHRTCACSG